MNAKFNLQAQTFKSISNPWVSVIRLTANDDRLSTRLACNKFFLDDMRQDASTDTDSRKINGMLSGLGNAQV